MRRYVLFSVLILTFIGLYGVEEDFTIKVDEYFQPWLKNGIDKEEIDRTEKKCNYAGRYIIFNQNLYVKGCESNAITALLLHLVKNGGLPDIDFIYQNHPGLVNNNFTAPVLCQCKLKGEIIGIPFHDRICINGSNRDPNKSVYYVSNEVLFNVVNDNLIPWENKLSKLIWRGGPNDTKGLAFKEYDMKRPRGIICEISLKYIPN